MALMSNMRRASTAAAKCAPVAGAKANAINSPVTDEIKDERWHRLMAAQQAISAKIMESKIGREIDVLIDEIDSKSGEAIGRSPWDAPEIDGNVFLPGNHDLSPGNVVRARITAAEEY